ncbi:hypothetical protein Lsai_0982 [Legionella sainthelensi]|uniref:Uncharacterized protein n=1 Tax=Legionella sainthelensi TaxID=28087 RepID=A0A0W0YNC8_9GAMM|nr:hypothetical protein Lsai_0982 [Legionella sainthelensi]
MAAIMRKIMPKGKDKLLQYKLAMYNSLFIHNNEIAYELLVLQNCTRCNPCISSF